MTLKEIQTGQNKFCGPAVLSSIAGITTDEAEIIIQDVRRLHRLRNPNVPVTGVWQWELNQAFEVLGWKVTHIRTQGKSLYMNMMYMSTPAVYLFYVPGHVIAIEIDSNGRRLLIDNHTKAPISVGNSARLSQRVLACVMLEKR